MKKAPLKYFHYKVQYTYEGYNGYDHRDSMQCKVIAANKYTAMKRFYKYFKEWKAYCEIDSWSCYKQDMDYKEYKKFKNRKKKEWITQSYPIPESLEQVYYDLCISNRDRKNKPRPNAIECPQFKCWM